MKRFVLAAKCIFIGTAIFAAPTALLAQDWPNRPVRLVVPFAAGGSGDILARVVAQHLSAKFQQQFVVENRPGAGGMVGTQQFISAAPDGYTIGMTNLSTMSLIPVINAAAAYDPIADFKHIAYIGGSPVVLAASPSIGVETIPSFIKYAQQPGKAFSFASSGVGSDGHLVGEAIAAALKVKGEHVPYKATAQALTDMIAGHLSFSTFTLSSTAPFLRSNSLKGLALTSDKRLADFPNLPTFKELNYPELVGTTWFSISGPAKLPDDVVNKINRGVIEAVSTPEVQARFRRDGFIAQPMSPKEFTQFIASENKRWRAVIEANGLAAKRQ